MPETPLKQVRIYTDGACSGNPGPGGYGVVLLYQQARKELSGGYRWTTNNRMELLALAKALAALRQPCKLEIFSDSKYLLGGFQGRWIENWQRNGWLTRAREPVRNGDLWRQLATLLAPHTVQFQWVKGHASNPENNRCDALAVAAIKSGKLVIDDAYEQENPRR